MPYIGNTIRAADDYRLIDDISSGFNGSTTSFALQVAGSAPVPFPKSPQQVLISVNGVIQEPDPTGSSGFNLVGTNIVFSSAPTNGHAFFGIIYATADYLNAGGNFPAGSLGAPSITFIGDENTGLFRKSGGSVGFVSDATEIANFDSNGITISSGNLIIPDSIIHNGDTDTKIRFSAANTVSVETGGSARAVIDSTGLEVTGSVHVSSDLRMGEKLKHANDQDTFISFPSNDHIGFTTNNTTRMTIDSSGRVGIGSTTPSQKITIVGSNEEDLVILSTGNAQDNTFISVRGDNEAGIRIRGGGSGRGGEIELAGGGRNSDPAVIKFSTTTGTSFTERMRLDSSGRLLLGTTTEGTATADDLTIATSGNTGITLRSGTSSNGNIFFSDATSGAGETAGYIQYDHSSDYMRFGTATNERVRIDSSGTLLVAHSSGRNNFNSAASTEHAPIIQLEGTNQRRAISITSSNTSDGGILMLARQNGNPGANTVVSSGDQIGRVDFQASGGTNMEIAAQITAEVDGTPGDNDMPGRLLFKTTADGANSASERMRIDSEGRVLIGKGTANTTTSQVQMGEHLGGYSWDVGDVPQVLIAGLNNESPSSGSLNIGFRVQDENANIMFQVSNTGGGNSDTGRVGIGTGVPDRQLHLEGNGTAIIRLTDNDTTGENASIVGMLEFETRDSNGAGVAANIRSEITDTTNGACNLAFSTGSPSTISTRMILSSSGAFTIAAQPCVAVTNVSSASNLTSSQNGVPITFTSTHISQGGMALANTRSRITVPVTGTYLVTMLISGGVTTVDPGDGIILRLRRNGSNYPSDDSHPVESFGSEINMEWAFSWNLPIELTANDYIEMVLDNIGGNVVYSQSRGYFSATLMH